jgi:hypothetical protein
MVVAFIYALLYVVPLIRICKPTNYVREQQLVRSIIVLTLTASLFRDYNIGGVRSTAMMVGVFWGLANLWPLAAEFEQASKNAADHHALPEETTDRQTVAC